MKKSLQTYTIILFFVFGYNSVFGQADRLQKISDTEEEIAEYIADNISTYKIPAEELQQIKKSSRFENPSISKEDIQKSLAAYKEYLLRADYFKLRPEKRTVYAPPP